MTRRPLATSGFRRQTQSQSSLGDGSLITDLNIFAAVGLWLRDSQAASLKITVCEPNKLLEQLETLLVDTWGYAGASRESQGDSDARRPPSFCADVTTLDLGECVCAGDQQIGEPASGLDGARATTTDERTSAIEPP